MRFFLTDEALRDLDSIYEYTYNKWGEAQADRYVDDVYSALQRLSNGKLYIHPNAAIKGYQRIKVGSHFVFFMQIDNEYRIFRILHESMDLVRHL